MRLRLIPLAPTMSRDTGAVRLFCSARGVQTHALSRRRTVFRTAVAKCGGPRRMRLSSIRLAPTISSSLRQNSSSAVLERYRHTLCKGGEHFSGLLWPGAEACVECACARYP